MHVIPPSTLRQDCLEFDTSINYKMRPLSKKKKLNYRKSAWPGSGSSQAFNPSRGRRVSNSQAFNPRQRQEGLCELETCLVYRASSTIGSKAKQRTPVSRNKTNKNVSAISVLIKNVSRRDGSVVKRTQTQFSAPTLSASRLPVNPATGEDLIPLATVATCT